MNKITLKAVIVLLSILFSSTLLYAKALVFAPHPDDDVIMSSGVIYRAVQRGDLVKVVYMTNGDSLGLERGYLRQGNSVKGQSYLGVPEDNLIFLGYPDSYLQALINNYVNESDTLITEYGQSETYGDRGLGRKDYHSYRFGVPANYNRVNILMDLEDIIAILLPEHIFVPSEFDRHSDHAATYRLLRLALSHIHDSNPNYAPVIHKTIIWPPSGGNWPNSMDASSYFSEIPNIDGTGLAWSNRESIDVPLSMQSIDYLTNPKYLAISSHTTEDQLYLTSFIHKDEIFWAENPFGVNHPPTVNAGFDQTVVNGTVVYLDGSQSRDPDGDYLSFLWTQRSGNPANLLNPTSANPFFTATTGLSQDEIITFELVVSDYEFYSPPDSVSVKIPSLQTLPDNIAPLATATASSESPQNGQTAVKAVDGIVDGYPGDYTREWATAGQGVGAWIALNWAVPYSVNRVVLYDRPNINDNILGGTITFSDGSSIIVGPLINNGNASGFTFPAKTIKSLTMTVTAVSSSTLNVGLSEIQVYGTPSTDQSQYSLAVSVNPSGSGTVTVNPIKSSYYAGEQVTLTATPGIGYTFGSWSGDTTGSVNPVAVTMNANKAVTANFAVLAGSLAVTPSGTLNATGAPGGPFVPGSVYYTLQNTGNSLINWSASATQNWVTLSSSGGVIASGASTTVTVSINNNAGSLGVGSYTDTVSFSNLTNNNGNTSRTVNLAIAEQMVNIAPLATATASSESPQNGQTAVKAVDGIVDGYPGDYTREWATAGQGVGAWIALNWAVPYSVNRVVLYDRPNINDNILGGTITFSDGSSIIVGPLINNGNASGFTFPAKTIKSLTMTVTAVSSSTLNVGLSEIQVYGTPSTDQSQYSLAVSVNPSGSGTVTVNPIKSSYYAGEQVTLTATPGIGYTFGSWSGDTTGSVNPVAVTMNANKAVTANFAVLAGSLAVTPSGTLNATGAPGGPFVPGSVYYTLQNTGNSLINWSASATQNWVTLSSSGGVIASGASTTVTVSINNNAGSLGVGSYTDTVSFSNLTNNNGNTSRTVNLAIAEQMVNIAPLATATASSESPQNGQTAVKAVDGIVDGYPGDYTREWATAGQGVGAWIALNWAVPYSVNRVVLYDRPNINDNILGGTITFSDGSSIIVGPLINNGNASGFTFPAKTIKSLTMTVTAVSSSTLNVGLSEIQVFGTPSGSGPSQ